MFLKTQQYIHKPKNRRVEVYRVHLCVICNWDPDCNISAKSTFFFFFVGLLQCTMQGLFLTFVFFTKIFCFLKPVQILRNPKFAPLAFDYFLTALHTSSTIPITLHGINRPQCKSRALNLLFSIDRLIWCP